MSLLLRRKMMGLITEGDNKDMGKFELVDTWIITPNAHVGHIFDLSQYEGKTEFIIHGIMPKASSEGATKVKMMAGANNMVYAQAKNNASVYDQELYAHVFLVDNTVVGSVSFQDGWALASNEVGIVSSPRVGNNTNFFITYGNFNEEGLSAAINVFAR